MIDGMKDMQGLDLAVDMEGKKILREKFSRTVVSVNFGDLFIVTFYLISLTSSFVPQKSLKKAQ